ncbi:MAG TPA: MarR family transcriptional regulator [Acidimicrobiales bacterium]
MRRADPATDDPNELRVAVDRLSRLLSSRRAYSRLIEAAGADLSQQGATLLVQLYRNGEPQTLTALAKHAHMDLSSASRQLRELEQANLISRVPDKEDRRVTHLRFTPQGRRLAKRLVDVRRGHLERTVASWPPEKRALFAQLINEFVDALTTTEVSPVEAPRARRR